MIPKLAFSVVVAAVVAGVALVSDVGVVVAVVAALAAVVAFWIFDAFSGDVAPSKPGGTASQRDSSTMAQPRSRSRWTSSSTSTNGSAADSLVRRVSPSSSARTYGSTDPA